MIMKKNVIAAILLTAAVAFSCTTKEESSKELINDGSVIYNPTATIKPFVLDGPATKTTLTIDAATGAKFTFVEGDALGVYPYSPEVGTQVGFTVSSSDATSCTFNGGGFGLKSGQMYAVYYPYSEAGNVDDPSEESITEIITNFPVDYTGQRQTSTDGETFGISAFDYLVDNGVTPAGNACDFEMQHIGALLVLDVTFPQAGNFTELSLTSSSADFIKTGTIDLTASTPVISDDQSGKTITLALGAEGGNGLAISEGQQVRFCMMVAPVDLSSSTVTLSATTSTGTTLSKELTKASREMVAGSAYRYRCNLDPSAAPEPEPTNLSENGTANSYIVDVDNINEAGYYFDCTIAGNGQTVDMASQNYTTHANVWPRVNGTYTSSLPEGGYVRVVLNQNNCISDVTIADGKITFKATGVKGNAKIQMRDAANNDPAWIWHIWCTDQPGTVTITDASSRGYSYGFMDRNMGALTNDVDASTPENMYGLYYQFGNPTGWTKDEYFNNKTGSWRMVDGIAGSPNAPYIDCSGDWYWFNPYGASAPKQMFGLLWGGGSAGNGTLKRGPEAIKTMYDPCPPGYKITPLDFLISASDAGGNVWGWYKNGTNGTVFFPYNGCINRNSQNGQILGVETTAYQESVGPYNPATDAPVWTCLWTSGHNNANMSYLYHIYAKGENRAGGGENPTKVLSYGMGVRCVAE